MQTAVHRQFGTVVKFEEIKNFWKQKRIKVYYDKTDTCIIKEKQFNTIFRIRGEHGTDY